jgi:hypothetical protein
MRGASRRNSRPSRSQSGVHICHVYLQNLGGVLGRSPRQNHRASGRFRSQFSRVGSGIGGRVFDSDFSAPEGQCSMTSIVIGATDESHQLVALSEYLKMGVECPVQLRIVDSDHSAAHVGELFPRPEGLDAANNSRRTVTNIDCAHNASALLSW